MLNEDITRVALMILEVVKLQVNHSFSVKSLKEKIKNNAEYKDRDESLVLEAAEFLKRANLIHQTGRNQFKYKHTTIEEIRFLAELYSDLVENFDEYFVRVEEDAEMFAETARLRFE